MQVSRIPEVLNAALVQFWPGGAGGRRSISCVTLVRSISECAGCRVGEVAVLTRDMSDPQELQAALSALSAGGAVVALIPDAHFTAEQRDRLHHPSGERRGVAVGLLGEHVDPVLAANAVSRALGSHPDATGAAFGAAESLQDLVDTLGKLLGNSVTLETPNHELLAFSATTVPVDRAREQTILRRAAQIEAITWVVRAGYVNRIRRSDRPVHIPPNPDLGFDGRVAMRVAAEGETVAILWATETARRLNEEDEAVMMAAAAAAASILIRQREAGRRQAQFVTELLEDVARGRITDPDGLRALATTLGWNLERRRQALVIEIDRLEELRLLDAGTSGQRLQRMRERLSEVVRLEILSVDPEAIIAPRTTGVIVLCAGPDGEADARKAHIQRLGDSIVGRVSSSIPQMTVTVGVGREFSELPGLAESLRQAELAARLGATLRGGNRATHYGDLGIHRALFTLQEHEEMITPALQRIIDYDNDHGTESVRTLAVYLGCMGRLRPAAEQLNIHRNTLEYRIRRIEEVAGVSLEDPTNRLALELGIRVLELRAAVGLTRPPS